MGDKSGIEWTDATWNPVVGCSVLSPGCANCYAMKMAARLEAMGGKAGAKYAGLTTPSKAGPVWNGTVRLDDSALDQPLRWKRPRRIFVNSMSDLFHEDLPFAEVARVFEVIGSTIRQGQGHIFQILTKRPERMAEYFDWARADTDASRICPAHWPGVWFGVSAEDQRRADERIPHLLRLPVSLRWISAEPLLGHIDLGQAVHALNWVVVGGESGPGARPMHPDWARGLRDQCQAADVPFLFKQWGNWMPIKQWSGHQGGGKFLPEDAIAPDGSWVSPDVNPDDIGGHRMRHVTKKAAGRVLDGRTWDQYPEEAAHA